MFVSFRLQVLSPQIVVANHHCNLSSQITFVNCHQESSSQIIIIYRYCQLSSLDPLTMATSRNSAASSSREQRKEQNKQLITQKRQQEAQANPTIGVAHFCTPTQYLPYPAPNNAVARTFLRYIMNLQQNVCPARPRNWSSILNHHDYRKNHSLIRFSDHIWNNLDCTHYVPVASLLGLQNQLNGGLPFPVLVSPLSRLGEIFQPKPPGPSQLSQPYWIQFWLLTQPRSLYRIIKNQHSILSPQPSHARLFETGSIFRL